MRIGLIGDVHCAEDKLSYALNELSSMGLNMLLAVGDYLNGPGNINHCMRMLQEHSVICVNGNHDVHMPSQQEEYEAWEKREKENALKYPELVRNQSTWAVLYAPTPYIPSKPDPRKEFSPPEFPYKKTETHWSEIDDDTRAFIESLPTHREIDTPDGKLLLCHGMGSSVYEYVPPEVFQKPQECLHYERLSELNTIVSEKKYTFIVSGHTHKANLALHEGIVFANAGAIGGGFYSCYCVLDTFLRELEIYRFWTSEKRKLKGPIKMRVPISH